MEPINLHMGKKNINGIEFFSAFAEKRLKKFNRLSKKIFYFHLKDYEFRFNHHDQDLNLLHMKIFRQKRLTSSSPYFIVGLTFKQKMNWQGWKL